MTTGTLAGTLCTPALAAPDAPKRVAAIVTIYRKDSHTDVLAGKIIEGWHQDGGAGPNLKLVSMYVDQTPNDDLSVALAKKHGFRLCKSIEEALTLGGNKLACDGVLSIGEHGDYPHNAKGQHLYPRRRFFDGIADVFERTGQVVPVFNDKHPGPEIGDMLAMAGRAKQLGIPWMAGSSLTVGYRDPAITLPFGSKLDACVAVGYSGLDIYGFHTLDVLQCIAERRKQAGSQPHELGVQWVHCLPVRNLPRILDEGLVPGEVLDACLTASRTDRESVQQANPEDSGIFLIKYRDGFRAMAVMAGDRASAISVAYRAAGQSVAAFRAEERVEPRYPHFACLLKAIEQMMLTGKPAYPVERTLLASGMLDRLLTSKLDGHKRLETPELAIEYTPVDYGFGQQLRPATSTQ